MVVWSGYSGTCTAHNDDHAMPALCFPLKWYFFLDEPNLSGPLVSFVCAKRGLSRWGLSAADFD
jgi:hypothetical protein